MKKKNNKMSKLFQSEEEKIKASGITSIGIKK